jgi:hypothetical protein
MTARDLRGVVSRRTNVGWLAAVAIAVHALAAGAAGQEIATAADVQSLRGAAFEARTDLARLRSGDAVHLKELRAELDAIRDRITDFEARLKRGEVVPRNDYIAARDRIADVRRRARSERTVSGAGLGPGASAPEGELVPALRLEIPARTPVEVQLLAPLDPSAARPDDRIEGATVKSVVVKGRVVVPAGTLMRGTVAATGPEKTVTLRFDETTIDFRTYRIDATVHVDRALRPGAIVRARFNVVEIRN